MLKKIIEATLGPWLVINQFSLAEYYIDEKHFGNETIIYKSSDILIRFSTDRGDIYVDVASTTVPSEWFFLNNLLESFGYRSEQFVGNSELQIKKLCTVLCEEFMKLKSMLMPAALPETRRKMEEFRRLKAKQMFPEME